MKKLIYILSFLFTSFIFAQGGPKVDVIKFRGEVTSAIRDTFDVPTGETWLIWNVTTSQLEISGSNDVWASASGGLVEGVNSVPTGVQFNQGTTNRIQLLSDLNGSPSIRLMAGVQDSTVYWVARNNQIDITFENGTDDYRFNNDGETDGIDVARKQYVDNAVSAGVLTVNEASEIQFTPYSTIASNTVQAAIQELLDESSSGGDFWTTPVDSDIVPDTNEVYDLGSISSYFLIGYINTLNTDIIFFNGGGVPDTDSGGAEGHLWYSSDDKKIKYNDNVSDYIALATESQLVADSISITDSGNNFTATDVEGALAELAAGGGTGDNLGNHTATQNLVMQGNNITGAGTIQTGIIGTGSSGSLSVQNELNMNFSQISNLGGATGPNQAVNKGQLDAAVSGLATDAELTTAVSAKDEADEIPVAATPTNYTASTPDVEAHLAGIDTALGTGAVDSGQGWDIVQDDATDQSYTLTNANVTVSGSSTGKRKWNERGRDTLNLSSITAQGISWREYASGTDSLTINRDADMRFVLPDSTVTSSEYIRIPPRTSAYITYKYDISTDKVFQIDVEDYVVGNYAPPAPSITNIFPEMAGVQEYPNSTVLPTIGTASASVETTDVFNGTTALNITGGTSQFLYRSFTPSGSNSSASYNLTGVVKRVSGSTVTIRVWQSATSFVSGGTYTVSGTGTFEPFDLNFSIDENAEVRVYFYVNGEAIYDNIIFGN